MFISRVNVTVAYNEYTTVNPDSIACLSRRDSLNTGSKLCMFVLASKTKVHAIQFKSALNYSSLDGL